MSTVTSNEIKKGAELQLRNGFTAVMYDNKKGNIRLAEVHGWCTEIGSIYVWDIVAAKIDGEWRNIVLTDKQIKARRAVRACGF